MKIAFIGIIKTGKGLSLLTKPDWVRRFRTIAVVEVAYAFSL